MREASLPRTVYGPGENWFTRHREKQAARVANVVVQMEVARMGRSLERTKRWLRNNPLKMLVEAPRHIQDGGHGR